MKKLVLLLAVAGLVVCASGAYAAVNNQVFVTYKNMAGAPFPETWSLTVQANLVGPMITVSKSQQNERTTQSGPTIMVASGDTIIYFISINNTGTGVNSATDVMITDTMAFDSMPGQTIEYVMSSAQPDSGQSIAGGVVKELAYYNGATWQPAFSNSIPPGAKGIRWILSVVGVGMNPNLQFKIKVTTP